MGDLATLRLRCPECRAGRVRLDGAVATCAACGVVFPSFRGRPVLVPGRGTLFTRADYEALAAAPPAAPRARRARWLPSLSINLSTARLLARLGDELDASAPADVLVVGGGRQRRELELRFANRPHVRLWICDVDVHADVDLFCDAHVLPFEDGTFAAVITTAVLEHVVDPERAAAEVARVVRAGGRVYSELPFMQQVHEGAYDFTRYTQGGHRRLWRAFDELDSGLVAGPGTALAWSLEYFAAALAPTPALVLPARGLARLASSWLQYLDHLCAGSPAALDAAACTYFYGRRRAEGEVPDPEIVARYAGAQSLRHV